MNNEARKTRFKDLSGMRFGRLTAIETVGINKHRNYLWKCLCDCGKERVFPSGKLISGRATHCGCLTTEIKRKIASKHGITAGGKPRTFVIWNGMKLRCFNPKSISYPRYGARGISVCEEWMVFENFHNWAINNGYDDGKEIDRIDPNGDYCPENCHWISQHLNRIKQRTTRNIEVEGKILSITAWSKELKVSKNTIYKYLNQSEEAFVDFVKQITK